MASFIFNRIGRLGVFGRGDEGGDERWRSRRRSRRFDISVRRFEVVFGVVTMSQFGSIKRLFYDGAYHGVRYEGVCDGGGRGEEEEGGGSRSGGFDPSREE